MILISVRNPKTTNSNKVRAIEQICVLDPANYNILVSSKIFLNQSTIERLPLIHGQINLIKFVESNKFDNVYNKI